MCAPNSRVEAPLTPTALYPIIQEGAPRGCLHLPGSYPHDQWQGTRIEGFVVAQGQPATPEAAAALRALEGPMRAAVLRLEGVAEGLRAPYKCQLAAAGGDAEAAGAQVWRIEVCIVWECVVESNVLSVNISTQLPYRHPPTQLTNQPDHGRQRQLAAPPAAAGHHPGAAKSPARRHPRLRRPGSRVWLRQSD